MNDAPHRTQLQDDIAAVDAMLTAATDHAFNADNETPPGTTTKSKIRDLRQLLDRARTACTWLAIDLGMTAPAVQLQPDAAASSDRHQERAA